MTLFGHGLTPKRPLSQPGQFLSNERVTVKGPKGEFQNVAVLGPERKEAQVEISLTDARTLGVNPPIRPSGNVTSSPGCTLIGPKGTPEDASRFHVTDKQVVSLKTFTDRPLVFEDVLVRVSKDYATYAHLDYDEANACGFRDGDLGRILP